MWGKPGQLTGAPYKCQSASISGDPRNQNKDLHDDDNGFRRPCVLRNYQFGGAWWYGRTAEERSSAQFGGKLYIRKKTKFL